MDKRWANTNLRNTPWLGLRRRIDLLFIIITLTLGL